MNKSIILVGLFLVSLTISAATVEDVVSKFPVPINETYTANDWDITKSIAGASWSHKGLRETAAAPFTKLGKIKLKNLGSADIFFSGARTMVFQIEITVTEGEGVVFEKGDFYSVLKNQFNTNAIIRKIRDSCPDEGVVSGSAVYKITLPGKKPM